MNIDPDRESENLPFGANHYLDSSNRLDTLREDIDFDESQVPEDVRKNAEESRELVLSIRRDIKSRIKENGWPEGPKDLTSPVDLFEQAKQTVAEKWNEYAGERFNRRVQEWIAILEGLKGSSPERIHEIDEIIKLFQNPERFEENFRSKQLGILESLRTLSPSIWGDLLYLSSERQLSEVVLARKWIKEFSDEDFQRIGMSRGELNIFMDLAGFLGKYFDSAYIKQGELADRPGGSVSTPLGAVPGVQYLYDVADESSAEGYQVKSFGEVFPFEFQRMAKHFETLAVKTQGLLNSGGLPDTYRQFPGYLRSLAVAFTSGEKNPTRLYAIWEDIFGQLNELAKQGCPIVMIPYAIAGVARDANKADVEIRLALRTSSTIELEDKFAKCSQVASGMNSGYLSSGLLSKAVNPPVVASYQPFAFGTNLYYFTPAQSLATGITLHENVVAGNVRRDVMKYFEKFFSRGEISSDELERKIVFQVGLHEIGHSVLPIEDGEVLKRMGVNRESFVMEELKAETMGIKLLFDSYRGKIPEELAKRLLYAIISGQFYNLATKSSDPGSFGERYFIPAAIIVQRLLEKGILIKEGDGYRVTDYNQGIFAVVAISDEVMALYANKSTTPEDVKTQFGLMKDKAEKDETFKGFMEDLKG